MSAKNEATPVGQILGDYTHPVHAPVMDTVLKVQEGELNLCACTGPFPGEPFCPCEMVRRGLPPSPARQKAMANAEARKPELLAALRKSGILADREKVSV